MKIDVKVPEKLIPLIVKPKPLKIAVGGRGSGKTIAFSDCFLKFCDDGERVICAREFQNSIDESVHSSMIRRINHHQISTLHPSAKTITSDKNGKIVYLGLARNLGSIKSFDGANKVWIEEGQYIAQDSIDLLFPTIRENGSEIWISMNRGSSKDAIAKSYLKKAEKSLKSKGYYEDDYMIVVDINYTDNPWFPEKLEIERKKNYEDMSRAKYDHIWNGHYSDTVEDAIIEPEWFDACIDAHIKLGFKPVGLKKVTYDPADSGDAKGLSCRHGVVVLDVQQKENGRIDDCTDWATDYALEVGADEFDYDADGIGGGLKSQIDRNFRSKRVNIIQFKGGESPENKESEYISTDSDKDGKTNGEMFRNKRAQYYWRLRDRCFRTYQAVVKGVYHDPDTLISFSSDIKIMDILRSEICTIPRKFVGSGRVQLMTKREMKDKLKLDSPNCADAVMMGESETDLAGVAYEPIQYDTW